MLKSILCYKNSKKLDKNNNHIKLSIKTANRKQVLYETDFSDKLLSIEWKESELENDDLQNYNIKVSFYIRQHQDNPALRKLQENIPLTVSDIAILEDILWFEENTMILTKTRQSIERININALVD